MRTHSGLKKWKCDHCERAFDKYTSLKLHLAAKHHDGEKPVYECEVDGCHKSYTMKVFKAQVSIHSKDIRLS